MLVSAGRPRRCVAARPGRARTGRGGGSGFAGPRPRGPGGAGPGTESRRAERERGKGRLGPACPPARLSSPGRVPGSVAREAAGAVVRLARRSGLRSRRPVRSGEAANCALKMHRPRWGGSSPRRLPRRRQTCPPASLPAPSPGLAGSPFRLPALPRDRGPRMAGAATVAARAFPARPAALRPRARPPAPLLCLLGLRAARPSHPRPCSSQASAVFSS